MSPLSIRFHMSISLFPKLLNQEVLMLSRSPAFLFMVSRREQRLWFSLLLGASVV